MSVPVKTAFRVKVVPLPLSHLFLARPVTDTERSHEKYKQIAASIKAIGIVEPPIVHPLGQGRYRVLDGRKRIDVLTERGSTTVDCIVASDDESFTYNHRVNYLSTIGEHQMILKALVHNSEEAIAQALNVDVAVIREKRNLLNGICPEAVEVLKARRVAPGAFSALRKMRLVRQVQAAELMVASNSYTARFARALLMGTTDEMRIEPQRNDRRDITPAQRAHLVHETDMLLQNAKAVEAGYGASLLTLSVCLRYVERVIHNRPVHDFLDSKHPDLLRELESITADVAPPQAG
jgi:ParB-like chromosome segregation protein Spo0J